ncbi:cox cluster protein [Haladaptatus sp. R4]|uniref:DUF6684 family protein n=1 Tax=Haladaptatus sp. R4 TaxID=1679489 RepID=UPI0007B49565|nr:DUF6684 family protein [Haladaptatus sp. R4]KZN22493.1 cox cluster protein [Haladaptatus sp. R4]
MSYSPFDRETLLDIVVNIVPLVILGFFFLLFFFYTPYPRNLLYQYLSLILVIVPFALLALLTWVAARYVG